MYRFTQTIELPRPLDEVFAFFADAQNLQALTPPWLSFRILTPTPIEMKVGALIDYRLTVRYLPMRWRTEITEWDPPHRFADSQLRGPYKRWHHTHEFHATPDGTAVTDRLEYDLYGGRLVGGLIHRFFVQRDVHTIFHYRSQRLGELFG